MIGRITGAVLVLTGSPILQPESNNTEFPIKIVSHSDQQNVRGDQETIWGFRTPSLLAWLWCAPLFVSFQVAHQLSRRPFTWPSWIFAEASFLHHECSNLCKCIPVVFNIPLAGNTFFIAEDDVSFVSPDTQNVMLDSFVHNHAGIGNISINHALPQPGTEQQNDPNR
jgi:hypothetical protein